MVFTAPSWLPEPLTPIPNTVPVGQFVLDGTGSPRTPATADRILIDAVTGQTFSVVVIAERVENLAKGLAQELGWSPNQGQPLDKVVGILSLNSPDYLVLSWAVHRLNGVVLPLHAGTENKELESHLAASNCKVLFASRSLSSAARQLAESCSLPQNRLFGLSSSGDATSAGEDVGRFLDDLVFAGSGLPPLEKLQWEDGQARRQIAFLASTSGSGGKQKLAQVTHHNIISNIAQIWAHESYTRKGQSKIGVMVLPMSHSYALVVSHMTMWAGDPTVLHPKFDIMAMLKSVGQVKVQRLYLIPAIISALAKHSALLKMFDCSSVETLVSGGGALDKDLANLVWSVKPDWEILVAYGLTETAIIASFGSPHDIVAGSSGSIIPLVQLRLIDSDGAEVETYDKPGEILIKGPNVVPAYLASDQPVQDCDGWLHTGDVGLIRLSEKTGHEHLFIVDRLKDIIKVKGKQVSPADIEAQLITHPAVQEAAVIGVAHGDAGERAQAYICLGKSATADKSEDDVRQSIREFIEQRMAQEYWLGNRIVFVDKIPRTLSGKVLKETLKEWAREGRTGSA